MFEQSREVLMAIINKEPRLDYLRDLAVSFNRTGDARRMSGDGPAAIIDYRAGLKITELLVAEAPGRHAGSAAISASATASSAWRCA